MPFTTKLNGSDPPLNGEEIDSAPPSPTLAPIDGTDAGGSESGAAKEGSLTYDLVGTEQDVRFRHDKVGNFIGGNSLEEAPPSRVADWIRSKGGHTVITKVLIANNGIAAVKEIRYVRKWAYETFGQEKAIEFTVMATPEDLRVNADYIRMADQYVEVPGGSNNNNYANVDVIVDVAERAGVHAVWAGWGHASENPRLPEALAASKQKIVFIGPPGTAMRSLGDKISSTIVAQSANVPTMPWSGSGISETEVSDQGFLTVGDEVYKRACVFNVEEGLERSEKIGWPVMIKASEGGGGKGIRKVDRKEDFTQAFNAVSGEVPGSPIFIMKLAGAARHLEVQLLGDQYGNAISLFGRDCSVQRRHQKIIEEAPVTIARQEVAEEMEKAAVRLAKLVGYVSAGTVEWLYSASDDNFYFLELNPRLQVEHPTTEMVSGVNLPASQLQIAMGLPLHRIRDIRTLYGKSPHGKSPIDFDFADPASAATQRKPSPKGHVVAVRITAENPDAGFKPSSGTLQELNFRSSTNVWGYFSVGTAGGLHEFADSQFGHIFAYGLDRSESRKNMVIALKELSIRGDFRTTVEYLIKLLETDAFEQNTITTAWLDSLIASHLTAERPDTTLAIVCGAVTKAYLLAEQCVAQFKTTLEKGQVPGKELLKTVHSLDFIYENIKYSVMMARSSPTLWTLYLNGKRTLVGFRPLADGGLLVLLDGRSHTVYFREEVGSLRVMIDSKTCLIEQENDPTQLRSPSPGKLIRFLVDSGDHINAGEAYAEIEVMKMYMPLVAAEDGIVNFVKQPGSTLEPGDILGVLALDDLTKVRRPIPFAGQLPDMGPPSLIGSKPHQRFTNCVEILNSILDGYDNQNTMASTLKDLVQVLKDPELPYGETQGILATLSGRLPSKLETSFRAILDSAHQKSLEFPAPKLTKTIDAYVRENVRAQDLGTFQNQIAPITSVLERYRSGLKMHEWGCLASLLRKYHDVESLFSGRQDDVLLQIRDQDRDNLERVAAFALSHAKAASKNALILLVLDLVKSGATLLAIETVFTDVLRDLANLDSKATTKVALKAREVLIHGALPSLNEREVQMEQILKSSVTKTYYGSPDVGYQPPDLDSLRELIDSRYTVFDVLPSFFLRKDLWINVAALEVYVRRAYRTYTITEIEYEQDEDDGLSPIITWTFHVSKTGSSTQTPAATPRTERNSSFTDLQWAIKHAEQDPLRVGTMFALRDFDQIESEMKRALQLYPSRDVLSSNVITDDWNVMNVAYVLGHDKDFDSKAAGANFIEIANRLSSDLHRRRLRRLTLLICHDGRYPMYFTVYKKGDEWVENEPIRDIEPALAFQLELGRLSNYQISPVFVENRQIHVYHAVGKDNPSESRFFVRALVRPGRLKGNVMTVDYLVSETDHLVQDILDTLEVASASYRNADANHVSLNFVYSLRLDFEDVQNALAGFIERHGKRLWRLRVTSSEIRIVIEDASGNTQPIRAVIENVSGFVVNYELYREVKADRGRTILKSIGPQGSLHLQSIDTPYETREFLQPKRYKAHVVGTTYCYDFPDLFRQALRREWKLAIEQVPGLHAPSDPLVARELVLDENGQPQEVTRTPGSNAIGMVGWMFIMKTPEYPQGRRVIAVANDITFKIGSFGPPEDDYFFKVTQLARRLGIPRIYLSANSGARLGIAEELVEHFSAAWVDENHPEKGFRYLYLTPERRAQLKNQGEDSVTTTKIEEDGETRYQIDSIVGLQDGLGVESLRGSGLIAGETSRAYDDIFTITLVTCRSVGIGAYLVRLGQRAVQVEGQPIILTGANALNKVLGREVYTSNLQLGGTQIMYRNGVSHLTAGNDLEGVSSLVRWLSYVPESRKHSIPITPTADSWDRLVDYTPIKGPYDPRWFIEGKMDEDGTWRSGFFDKGSFQETLSGWAQTVVVGRARLGGVPMGVIAVETRTIERTVPADPANASSLEQKIMEAGQVWYPNSAFKTGQAIFDFNREGIPLIIFANWRGFSGGQQDMFDEVLKRGSLIVDGLSAYKAPVFVYIVPNGELRGGAWVVVDPSINQNGMMEMYADKTSRAGVLEPEGIVEIKFRKEKLLQLMSRLDPTYAEIKARTDPATNSHDDVAHAKNELVAREKRLWPTYSQIALQFADLHDRSSRMKAKGTIREELEWKDSRRFFYWRLRRRLLEEKVLEEIHQADKSLSREERLAALNETITTALEDEDLSNDQQVTDALERNYDLATATIKKTRTRGIEKTIRELIAEDPESAHAALREVFGDQFTV